MAAPANPKLTFVRGDDESVLLYIDSDALSTPVNITGRTYVMSIGVPGSTPIITDAGTVTGASGLVQFDFTDTQTDLLVGSGYSYDVVQTASGDESTLLLGALTVVTRVAA
tara:strand:+ start:349 stop:681 length:333 start_codon:yes stop_codon:yes gene_type:complete